MVNQLTIEIETSPGTWQDITSYVRGEEIQISRGRSDEASQASPQRMTLALDNRDGRFLPRNPMSPLYGMIGRNTAVRCKIDNGAFTRIYGVIPEFAPEWIENHADNIVQVEAAGILRRLGQGQPAVSTGLRDWVLSQATLAAYYPLSGSDGTTYSQNIAPGKTGTFRGTAGAAFSYGADMGAPWLDTGMALNNTGDFEFMEGAAGATGAHAALDFVFQSSNLGVLDVRLWPTTDSYFNLRLNTSADAATMQVSYYDDSAGVITEPATAFVPELQDNQLHTLRFQLRNHAAAPIEYLVYVDGVLITSGDNGITQTLSSIPLFRFLYSRYTGQDVVNLAHLALWADNTEANLPTVTDFTQAAFAYTGEEAVARLTRVCADGNIPLSVTSSAVESTPMGPQFSETRLEQLLDVEATDMGILTESRSSTGLGYITRASLYNRTPAFTLAYSIGQVVAPLQPVDDDRVTQNDVTAQSRAGGFARVTVDTGPLSTQDPPNGVGRYETSMTVNPETDGYLAGVAAWTANIGTLDRPRWPSVTVNLNTAGIQNQAGLAAAIKAADVGDWFTITGMSKAFVYDTVTLIIIGYTETITQFIHSITFNCIPAEPYMVGAWSTSASSGSFRWDTDSSTLNSSATSTATSLSVASPAGTALWTTDSSAFPFDVNVGGERITVTNITGASSPQTFTVTRSINGVVKAQTSGTGVRLWDTPRWAL